MSESFLTRRLKYEENNRLRLPGDAYHLYKRSYPILIKTTYSVSDVRVALQVMKTFAVPD